MEIGENREGFGAWPKRKFLYFWFPVTFILTGALHALVMITFINLNFKTYVYSLHPLG